MKNQDVYIAKFTFTYQNKIGQCTSRVYLENVYVLKIEMRNGAGKEFPKKRLKKNNGIIIVSEHYTYNLFLVSDLWNKKCDFVSDYLIYPSKTSDDTPQNRELMNETRSLLTANFNTVYYFLESKFWGV